MITYTSGRTLYGNLTKDSSANNLTFGDTLIGDGIRAVRSLRSWWFDEVVKSVATVASQQGYEVPNGVDKLTDVYVQVGNVTYRPLYVESGDNWATVIASNLGTSDAPLFWYRQGNKVLFAPTPASDGNTVYFRGRRLPKTPSIADYTTGTVSAVAAAGTTVTGSGTTWTASMAGRFIKITESNAANNGDGQWYEIDSVASATSLTLTKPYEGTAIVAGSAAYTIGQSYGIPQEYDVAPVYRAAAIYHEKVDKAVADRYWRIYDGGVEAGLSGEYGGLVRRMIDDAEKTASKYLPPDFLNNLIDPNVPPRTLITGV